MRARKRSFDFVTFGAGLTLVLAVVVSPSCSKEASERAEQATDRGEAPVATEAPPPRLELERPQVFPPLAALPQLYGDRQMPVEESVLAHIEMRDAAAAGWSSEVFADHAEERLTTFFEALVDPDDDGEALASILDDPFEGTTSFVPLETERDFDDGTLIAERGTRYDDELRGREALPEIASQLRASLAPGTPVEVGSTVTSARRAEGSDRYLTRASVRLAQRGAAPLQRDLELDITWNAADPRAPRIVALRLDELVAARSGRALFADVTDALIGGTERYETEILRGVDEYFGRIDRAAGIAFQGMHGLAVGDLDGDGLDDVFVCQQVGLPNQLLIRQLDGTYVDRAREARVDLLEPTRLALIVDLDNDGHQDLVQAVGPSLIVGFNEGDGTFSGFTALRAKNAAHFYSLSAADADGDGWIDLYGGRYSLGGVMKGAPSPYHDADNGASNSFWRNDGARGFVDATEEAGFAVGNSKFTLSSMWEDFDDDGDPDLYVVNDFGRNNLFQNDGEGHFVDVATEASAFDVGAGMGASVADFDLDGDLDLYVTNMWSAPGQRVVEQSERFMPEVGTDVLRWYRKHSSGNTVLANRGDGTFEDVTDRVGASLGYWGWGGMFLDFDNDGYDDLYVPCGQTTREGATYDLESFFWRGVIALSPPEPGLVPEYNDAFTAIHHLVMNENYDWNGREPNVAYLNVKGERFADVSVLTEADSRGDGRCVALTDFDGDGRQDMILKSRTAPRVQMLHNRSTSRAGALTIDLIGVTCNRDAIGAQVRVEVDGRTLRKGVRAGEGYLCQSSKRLHFGLAEARAAERVAVRWPDGSETEYTNVAAGHYVIRQGEAPRAVERDAELASRLAALEHDVPERNPRIVSRLPLVERLPMSPFPLPSSTDPDRTVASFEGAPLVVQLWTSADRSGEYGLAELQAAQGALDAAQAKVVTLSVDDGPYLARARKMATSAGFEEGYADARTRIAYEMPLLETIGSYARVPVPVTLLLDSNGELVSVYVGVPFAEELSTDVANLQRYTQERWATIIGGRLTGQRERRYRQLAKFYRTYGFPELSSFYREFARALRDGTKEE